MFAVKTWNPWRDLAQLQSDMDRLWGGYNSSRQNGAWPQFNIWTGEEQAIVTAELPGINPEKLEIHVTQNVLTISGRYEDESLQEGEAFHRRERVARSFERKLKLPFVVDANQADASYKNGVLEVRLSRPEEEKPRRLIVNAG